LISESDTGQQKEGVRRSLLGIAAFIALILGLFAASMIAPKSLSREEFMTLGYFQLEYVREIADFRLLDENSQVFNVEGLRGHWSLLFFGYTHCPDVCPVTLAKLNKTMEKIDAELAAKIRVMLVSVDPERDQPSVLKEYVAAFNPAFRGITGEFDEIVKLAGQVNIAFGKVPGETQGSYLVDHSGSIVVVNPNGYYAGFIKPPHQPEDVATILVALLGE
jgi:protein SCO1/2